VHCVGKRWHTYSFVLSFRRLRVCLCLCVCVCVCCVYVQCCTECACVWRGLCKGVCQLCACCVLRSRNTTIRKVTYNNVVHFLFLVAEIRPATIALDDGETVGHRILDLDLSRQLAGTGGAGHAPHLSSAQPSNAHRFLPLPLLLSFASQPLASFSPPRSHVRWIRLRRVLNSSSHELVC